MDGTRTLLQVELLDSCFIRGDGRTLDSDRVLLDGLSGIDGDLIVGLVTVLESQIIVLEVNVEVRVDEFVLDVLPDHAGHLISVELNDRILDLDLGRAGRHGASVSAGETIGSRKVSRRAIGRGSTVGGSKDRAG